MPVFRAYRRQKFHKASQVMIDRVNQIIATYAAQGFALTLRQVYYRCVANGWIPNDQKEYKNLGGLIDRARYAGLIPWDQIEDRTRNRRTSDGYTWTPERYLEAVAPSYKLSRWNDQPIHVEVWVEKDALVDVVANACDPLFAPYFSCRGYVSSTEMWQAGQRLKSEAFRGKECVILHLGDHDPSGIHMSTDIEERLSLFMDGNSHHLEVRRIALTMDQIRQYDPPPNPAKQDDPRFADYERIYGEESWELDALDPQVMVDLITSEIQPMIDDGLWLAVAQQERKDRVLLETISDNLDLVKERLSDEGLLETE